MSRLSVPRPRTLRGRLALYYGIVLAIVLLVYTGTVYLVAMVDDDDDDSEREAAESARAARHLLMALGVSLPVAVTLASAGGLWVARRVLSPLDQVVRIAENLELESLSSRVPMPPGQAAELGRLGTSINAMVERLQRSVDGLRRFTADASHELRTPVATMMGEIEVALRQYRDPDELRVTLEETLERLENFARLIELLLTFARADARELPIGRDRCDVATVTRSVIDAYEAIATDRGLTLTCSYQEGVVVFADSLWLGRAVINLVDNACKFTPAGGAIRVTVERAARRCLITVTDTGPGLTAEESERAFERFYRGADARASVVGFGLGLPLARDIVRVLGGELNVAASEVSGARFCIDLPAASSSADAPPAGQAHSVRPSIS